MKKCPKKSSNTVELMEKDGFGPNPAYGFFVCEKEGTEKLLERRFITIGILLEGKADLSRRSYCHRIRKSSGCGVNYFLIGLWAKGLEERLHRYDVASTGLE